MGAKKWSDIKSKRFSEEDVAASRAEAEREVLELNLRAVRELAGKTQAQVAELVEMNQGNLSEFERREDHLVSKLRKYVEALGGELVIEARFEDKSVRLRGV